MPSFFVFFLSPFLFFPQVTESKQLTHAQLQKPIHEDLETGQPSGESEKYSAGADSVPVVPLYQYNATSNTVLNRVLNAIMIILIPCASIVSLNAVPDTNKRVGMICAFSLVCAVGMAVCSSASRLEVFAVSAA